MSKPSAFNEKIRELVYERARGRCERCGGGGNAWQYHHRRPRGMGGTSRKDSGGAANALLLHFHCHEWVERNRKEAKEAGFLVDQWHDPREVKVKMWDGWHYLSEDGTLISDLRGVV